MKQPIYNTALYLRLSRDDEGAGESNSIATQRMMLRRYAEQNSLYIVDEYIDDGYSGTNFNRPNFQRMPPLFFLPVTAIMGADNIIG